MVYCHLLKHSPMRKVALSISRSCVGTAMWYHRSTRHPKCINAKATDTDARIRDDFGKVTANRVGKTTIWANDESCEVEVTPRYKTYMEPCMDWGASESEVTDFMNGYGNLGKNGNTLGFSDQDNGIVYMYVFENNSLSSSAIGAKFSSKGEEITNFLLERYVPITIDDSSYIVYMTNIDKTIGVVVSINASSGLMMVLYTPFSKNNIDTRTTFSKLNRHIQCNMAHMEEGNISMINEIFDKFKKY